MNYIKILGASGSKTKGHNTTSFQIFKNIIIDAGNIVGALGDETLEVDHIFITHSHADHISDLPYVIEGFFDKREKPLKIYGLKETIDVLSAHFFNDTVWPDFTKIKLLNSTQDSLVLETISLEEEIFIDDYKIKPIKANHIDGACGYLINKKDESFVISGDTYINYDLIDLINKDKKIKSLLLECSFPNRLNGLAKASEHLTPELILENLKALKRDDLSIFYYHLKPNYYNEILNDIKECSLLNYNGKVLKEGDVIHVNTGKLKRDVLTQSELDEIMNINLTLSSENDKDKLLEDILTLTRKLTNAQAGTLYIKSKDEKYLNFKVVQNDILGTDLSTSKDNLNWPALELYERDTNTNNSMVSVVCANEKRTINIKDVYTVDDYEFAGTKKFDALTGYRSKSMLVIPLINHEDETIGVLQLINKVDENCENEILEFNKFDEKVIKYLASQAAVTITNIQLVNDLENLLDAFVTTIAKAIDAKSPYTSCHIEKVEKIALMIAEAINDDQTVYKDIKYDAINYKELALAAWMHDVGKISIPDYIMDKATKLEKIFDRIELIEQRIELIKKDLEIKSLKQLLPKDEFEKEVDKLDKYKAFIKKLNVGSEFMSEKDEKMLNKISEEKYEIDGENIFILNQNETYNLSIKKGTLTPEELDKIRHHAYLSYDMISSLPFPKKYKNVLNIACNHHEKLNGQGYPRGLNEDQISLEDRIMILADVFEALTANDRPYKETMRLSQVKNILYRIANNGEIDKYLLDFFFNSDAFKKYTNGELEKNQLDI